MGAALTRRFSGFMFGYWGRFFFILFLGSMAIAIVNSNSGELWVVVPIVAAFTLANALLNCFIIRSHPGFQSGEAHVLADQERQAAASAAPLGRTDFGNDHVQPPAPAYTNTSPAYSSAPYSSSSKPTSGGGDNPFAAVVVVCLPFRVPSRRARNRLTRRGRAHAHTHSERFV